LQSKGLSLLAPLLKVYDANLTQLASTSLSGYAGGTVTATVSVTPGQTYFIMVDGANNTASGAGAYGLSLNFGTGASPAIPTPNPHTANGNPLSGGGGQATRVSQEYRVNTTTTDTQQTFDQSKAVAMDAVGNSVVVWASHNQDGNSWGIYGQRFGTNGNAV